MSNHGSDATQPRDTLLLRLLKTLPQPRPKGARRREAYGESQRSVESEDDGRKEIKPVEFNLAAAGADLAALAEREIEYLQEVR